MTPTHTIRVNPVHTLAILAKGLVDAGILSPIQAKTARITLYRVKEHKGKPGIGLTIEVMEMGDKVKAEHGIIHSQFACVGYEGLKPLKEERDIRKGAERSFEIESKYRNEIRENLDKQKKEMGKTHEI